MSRRALACLVVASMLLALGRAAVADEGVRIAVTSSDLSSFPSVDMSVSVSGPDGRPFVLAPSEVEVWIGDERIPASVSSSVELRPVDVVLVVDRSGSMSGRALADAIAAIGSFLERLGPRDRAALVEISTQATILQGLTGDRSAVAATASRIAAGGDTALYDAVALAARHLTDAGRPEARQAILVLTDGFDTASTTSLAQVEQLVARRTVDLVALGPGPDAGTLAQLAAAGTGGAVLRAPTSTQLADIYAALAERLRADNGVRFQVPTDRYAPEIPVRIVARRDGSVLGETRVDLAMPVVIPDTAAAPTAPVAAAEQAGARALPPEDPGDPAPLLAGMLGSATTLALISWVLLALAPPWARRPGAAIGGVSLASPARRRGTPPIAARRALRRLALGTAHLARVRTSPSADLELDRAGRPFGLEPLELTGMRLIIVGAVAAIALVGALAIGAGPAGVAASAGWGILAGYTVPTVVLRVAITSRQRAIRRALPTTLDMLTLCVEAGLSLDGALAHVSRHAEGPLCDEVHRLLLELQVGVDRREALRHLALRADVPEVTRLVNAMLQADVLGVGIGRALQDQAQEARTRRRQRAETLARTAPVKMLFPIVFLIFPALFLVILGPAAPRLSAIFDLAR